MRMTVIDPGGLVFDAPRTSRAVRKALQAAARGVKADFDRTTESWTKPAVFVIEEHGDEIEIATDNEIYGYVDAGTPPHIITASGGVLAFGAGGSPKTRPRVIGSGRGSKGTQMVFTQVVHHPGTEARAFSETIYAKWDQTIGEILQSALDGI